MKLHLRRSGGFGNLVVEGVVDTAQLEPELAAKVEAAFSGDVAESEMEASPHAADMQEYEVIVNPGSFDTEPRRMIMSHGTAPAETLELVDGLVQRILQAKVAARRAGEEE